MTTKELAVSAGIPLSTVYRRFSGEHGWTALELRRVSTALDVPVAVLYESPEELIPAIRTGSFARSPGQAHLQLIAGGGAPAESDSRSGAGRGTGPRPQLVRS